MVFVSAASTRSDHISATSFVFLRLVIEVDGATHTGDKQAEHDRRRTEWLHSQNFRVLRFWNVHVFENIEDVLDRIDAAMREHPLPPAPSRKRRGEIGMNSRGPG